MKYDVNSGQKVLNDSVSCVCGHCGTFTSVDVFQLYGKADTGVLAFYSGRCRHCGAPVIIDEIHKKNIPPSKDFSNIEYLPENINALYNEIRDAYSIGAYTCSVMAARTLLSHIAVEKEAESNRTFEYYVEYIVDCYLGKKDAKDWVNTIRKYANNTIHKLLIASKESAKIIITFIETILKIIYEYPKKIIDKKPTENIETNSSTKTEII